MTNKYKLKILWAVICISVLAFAVYYYLLTGSLIGTGCLIVVIIMITALVFNQLHNTNQAKDLMVKSMSDYYHVDPKHITIVGRIAYLDPPYKKIMIKINLVNFQKEVIHERY